MNFLRIVEANILALSFMQIALVILGAFMLGILILAQRARDHFDLRNLIADGDQVNRYAFAFMQGSTALTWAFIYYAWDHRLNVTDFVAYGLLMMFPEAVRSSLGPWLMQRLGLPQQRDCDRKE